MGRLTTIKPRIHSAPKREMAMVIPDAKEPRPVRQIIEPLLGAIIVLVVGVACKEFGLSSGWSFFAAGFIGILGVEQVRQLGRKWAERKADGQ